MGHKTASRPSRSNRSGLGWRVLIPLLGAAVLHFASFDFRRQPIFTDIGFFLYFAAQTARGAVPYLDYFEHKTPLAIFMGSWLHLLGQAGGIDPLYVIRVGYLLIAAGAAMVTSLALIRLAGNRPGAGWIALLVYCGFTLLGFLPATGNVPKMIGMLAAVGAALLVGARKWFWAGACVGVAAMDWQPCGALAGIGVLLAGLSCQSRKDAVARTIAGMTVVLLPFLVYFALAGALGAFLDMTFASSFSRATTDGESFGKRWRWIWTLLHLYPAEWLVYCAGLGLLMFMLHLIRARSTTAFPFLISLAAYHCGIVAFSLIDFQGLGDLFVLEGSLAFFAAIPLVDLYYLLLRAKTRLAGQVAHVFPQALGLVTGALLLLLIQPSFLRQGWRVSSLPPMGKPGVTLEQQLQVAGRFFEVAGRGSVAFLWQHDVLFLGGGTNALPFVYWNAATLSYWRDGESSSLTTLSRLVRSRAPDVIVARPQWLPYLIVAEPGPRQPFNYRPLLITSDHGTYGITAWFRNDIAWPAVRGVRPSIPRSSG
jgi:hypothetical protein